MRLPILALLSLIPGGLPAESRAASYEWEAMLPARTEHYGLVEFSGALEAKNGDVLISGQDMHGEYLARLNQDGGLRWLGHSAYPTGAGSVFIGIRETSRGIVTLWGCCGEPGWTAVLYGDTGGVAGRLDLGYPRGILDVTQSAQVVFLSNVLGQGRTLVSAEGRDLIGSSAWKTPLISARIDEVVGIHAVGDSCIAVLDRMGGTAGDTLMATLLDGAGKALWSLQVPTGVKVDGYPDNQSILWSQIAYDGWGRIVLAGLVADLPVDSAPPAAIALAVFTTGGDMLWLKRFPLDSPMHTVPSISDWQIASLSAGTEGIRLNLSHMSRNTWSTRVIPWSGEGEGTYFDTPPLDIPSGYVSCEPLPGGSCIGFGSTSASTGLKLPHNPLDSTWSAIGLGYPVVFGPVAESGKQWRSLRITEYADTIWTHPATNPESPGFLQTEGPGFYFLLPTKDGGAVAGGRLWRRNGEDTLSVIAIKLPPGEIDALPIRQSVLRTKARENKGAIPFDASGRFRWKARSPIFLYRP